MKNINLMRSLSAVLLSYMLVAQSAPAFAVGAGDKPALSQGDTNTVNGWIAAKVAATRQPYCYRQSYGRGVGVPLSTCDANQQKNGLLCYPDCKAGYGGAGPVCWQECPSGYTDTGAFCHISKSLTDKGSMHCGPWYHFGTDCHLECPSGYTNAGLFCALNTPSKPAGWKGLTGLDLIKDSYGRGAGYPMKCGCEDMSTPPMRTVVMFGRKIEMPAGPAVCTKKLQEDVGLCYKNCNNGYHGVGPVCWQNCPSDLTECGAGCANGTTSCVSNTANMVIAPIALVANIVSAGSASKAATAGEDAAKLAEDASTLQKMQNTYKEISAAYKEEIAAAKLAKKAVSIGVTTGKAIDMWVNDAVGNFRSITTNEVASTLDQKFAGHKAAEDWVKRQYATQNLGLMMKQDFGQSAQDALSIAATVDPTGVMSVVSAYANPKCATDDAFPTVRILY
jgi:hypothetical protein